MSETLTCSGLAELIEAVQEENNYGSPSIEDILVDIAGSDLAVIEWICKLVPKESIKALKVYGDNPLWGDKSMDPATVLEKYAKITKHPS